MIGKERGAYILCRRINAFQDLQVELVCRLLVKHQRRGWHDAAVSALNRLRAGAALPPSMPLPA